MSLFGLKSPESAPGEVAPEALAELLDHAYQDYARARCLIDFGVGTDQVLDGLRTLSRLRARCAEL